MKNKIIILLIFLYFFLVGWWSLLGEDRLIWAASYQSMALLGGLFGVIMARGWGGFSSYVGKAISFFSIGLLFQVLGQSIFSFYNLFLVIDIPYPSWADIGFFGSVLCYILGTYFLLKSAGAKFSLKLYKNQIIAAVLPISILFFSYLIFLRDYDFVEVSNLQVFFDFGYPLGQAFYVSLAFLTYLLSRNFLGGLMKGKVLLVVLALIVQFFADYNFLFQSLNATWVNGGYGDVLYLTAYLFMAIAVTGFNKDNLNQN